MSNELTPAQRAANFKAVTRQNLQTLPTQNLVEGGSFDIVLPKARFLSRIFLKCDLKYTAPATLTDEHKAVITENIHGVLSNITLNLNTGFKPYIIGGAALKVMNMLYDHGSLAQYDHNISDTGACVCYEMPLTLNASDPVGLVLLQNANTSVNLSGEMANISNLFSAVGAFSDVSMTVTPMLETYTIPSNKDAYPSLSLLKLTNSRPEVLIPGSENIVRLSVGTIYRKIIIQTYNTDGKPVALDDNAIISIVFNQADTPYNVTAGMLRMWNFRAYGHALPDGVYVFDFSTADIPEHLGSRDLVDTERLTEFWLKINTNTDTVRAVITTECLTRVQA